VGGLLGRLGAVYFVFAVLVPVLPAPRTRALGGVGLALLGLGAAGQAVGGTGGGAGFTLVNGILAALGALIATLAAVLAWRRRRAPGVLREVGEAAPDRGHPGLDPLLLAGLTLAAAGPHLLAIGVGMLLALAAAARGAVRAGRTLWLAPLVAAGGLLSVGLYLALTILGPAGGAVAGLADGPFSPAAERLLAGLLGGAGLLVAGLPPLHRAPWGLSLTPIGAILLARIVAPGFPGGLADWQAPAAFLVVAALAGAAVGGRWLGVVAAGGTAALWSGLPEGIVPGCVLVLWAWMADQLASLATRRGIGIVDRWSGLPGLVPALAALPALTALLRAQVLISALGVVAVAVGLSIEAGHRFRHG
jgi:hypothetical protein